MVEIEFRYPQNPRFQRNLMRRLELLATPAYVTNGLKVAVQRWADRKAIPKFRAEYWRVQESEKYVRTYKLYQGWKADIGISHGSLAIVFSNRASDHGVRYWGYVMHDEFQSERNQDAGWNTIQQILGEEGETMREDAQAWISRHLP